MKRTVLLRGSAALLIFCFVAAGALHAAAEEEYTFLPDDAEQIETYTSGDYTYSILTDSADSNHQAAQIESYAGSEAELVIPAELDGLEVIALGDYAFTNAQYLQSVTLPETVIGFGNFTFANCTNLREYQVAAENPFFESREGILYAENGTALMRWPLAQQPTDVVIPDEIISIGNVAFTGSRTLSSVTLPEGLQYIGISAFSDCTELTEIVIPDGVTEISAYCFNSCPRLKTVSLPAALTVIGNAAFSATAIEQITLPETLTAIGQQAFAATALKEVTIPASVTEIGYCAFGWNVSQTGEMLMNGNFVIHGYSGSAAESYANDYGEGNAFIFDALDSESEAAAAEDTSQHSSETESGSTGIIRIIGIVVCCVLLAVIAAVAILTGKKSQPEKPEKEAPTDES